MLKRCVVTYLLLQSAIVAHTFKPSNWEAEAGRSLEFEASLVHRTSSRKAGITQRNPISKTKNRQTDRQKQEGNWA